MRRIFAGLFMSLDGVVETPERWIGPYWSDEINKRINQGIQDADAILVGRNTYVLFTGMWQPQGDSSPMAAFLNNTHKYVVSSTLKELAWPEASLVTGDLGARIAELKSRPGKNIQVPGSPRLVAALLADGLLDDLALYIAPVVVGAGQRLFDDVGKQIPLLLTESGSLPKGVISIRYVHA